MDDPVDRKLEIARALAAKIFAEKTPQKQIEVDNSTGVKVVRGVGTGEIISNPQYGSVYSMEIERKYITRYHLHSIPIEMQKMSRHATVSVRSLVRTLRECLKASFFACEINIGICPDAGTSTLDFIGDSDYRRRVVRGQSTCFECLDQKDVVLQIAAVKQRPKDSVTPSLTDGETVIYVPLIGSAGGLGVIEIHGLRSPTITDTTNFERSPDFLRALINAKDYSFMAHTRLWRLPGARSGGHVSEFDTKDYSNAAVGVVQGKVVAAITELNGVPFFGGARYNIQWEDGLKEEAVSAADLVAVYRNTPQSLGCTSAVTEELIDELKKHAAAAAEIIERQRTVEALKRTQDSVNVPNLRDIDICERCLGSLVGILHGAREASLVGFETVASTDIVGDGNKNFTLHVLQRKNPKQRIITRGLVKTPQRAVDEYVEERRLLSMGISPTKKRKSLFVDKDDDEDLEAMRASPLSVFRDVTREERAQKKKDTGVEWVVVELALPSYYHWPIKPTCSRFFLVVLKAKNKNRQADKSDLNSIEAIATILAKALTISCEKEVRKQARRQAMLRVDRSLYEWRDLPTAEDICKNIIDVVAEVAPGTSSYTALLKPGGEILEYNAASAGSEMTGKKLNLNEGISFSVIDHMETVAVQEGETDKSKLIKVGDYCNVQYGKIFDRAKITANRGHGFYDVVYGPESFIPREAGVSISRIAPLNTSYRMKSFGSFKFPVLCFPVKHRDKAVGVLGMDTFDAVHHAPYDPQPEPGLKLFLEHLGKVLGSCIDIQRKKRSLRMASKVSRNVNSGNDDLFNALFDVLFTNLLYTTTVAIVHVSAEDRTDADHLDILNFRGEKLNKEVRATLATYDNRKSSKKPVQFKGTRMVWLLCPIKLPIAGDKKTASFRKKKASFKLKEYIIAVVSKRDISEVDTEFLHAVQKFATMILQNMETRKQKAEIRTDALQAVENICKIWNEYVDNRDEFFDEICDAINMCYMSANIYLGKLDGHAESITYVMASKFSRMKGNKLLRSYKTGVSFEPLDKFTHVIATKSDYELCKRLHHFGSATNVDYPFVVVPIATFLDTPLAVLAADACEDIAQEEDDTVNEVVSFMYSVAGHLGYPIKSFLVHDSIQELKRIERTSKNYLEGFRAIKEVIFGTLPYAKKISEVLVSTCTSEAYENELNQELVYAFRLVDAVCFPGSVVNPVVVIQWHGATIFTCPCPSPEILDGSSPPVSIVRIPSGVKYIDVELRVLIRGLVNNVNRDVGKRVITLQDMMNNGAMMYEHTIPCIYSPLSAIHAGRIKFVGRLYCGDDVVRLSVHKISCTNLSPTTGGTPLMSEASTLDPYCVVRWKGVEIGKTEMIRNSLNPIFKNLDIVVKPTVDDICSEDKLLSVEIWELDGIEGGKLLGYRKFSLNELQDGGNTRYWPLELIKFDADRGAKVRVRTGAEVQFHTSLVRAVQMSEDTAREELAIPFLSTKMTDYEEGVEDDNDCRQESKGRDTVLEIQSIRNIVLYRSEFEIESGDLCPLVNPYCIIFLNGEEVARTASAHLKDYSLDSAVLASVSPGVSFSSNNGCHDCDIEMEGPKPTHNSNSMYDWDDEIFPLHIPNAVDLDSCTLRIDVYIVDSRRKGILLGSICIAEKSFSSLLCSNSVKKRWYDVESIASIEGSPYMCGEVLISGRPSTVTSPDIEEKIVDPPQLSIRLDSISLKQEFWSQLKANTVGINPFSCTLVVHWNGQAVISKRFIEADCAEVSSDFYAVDMSPMESAAFRRPNDILLENGNIRADLWYGDTNGSDGHLAARTVIDKAELVAYIDQPLRRSLECEMKMCESSGNTFFWNKASNGTGLLVAKVALNMGRFGEDDNVECDGRKLWLDVLGAGGLVAPSYLEARRPNPFCKVYWNDKLLGQTCIMWNSCDPIWTFHRFDLPVPMIDVVDEPLEYCSLRLEIWAVAAKTPGAGYDFLGCSEINGEDLVQVIKSIHAVLKWQSLELHPELPLKQQEYVCSGKGAVKFRVAYAHRVVNDKECDDHPGGEYRIRINEAIGLKEVDTFTKTNALVIIYWNDDEIGRTEVIPKEVNPKWMDEVFLIRVPGNEYLRDQRLQFHVYDFTGGSTGEFLGYTTTLGGNKLVEFLTGSFDTPKEMPLYPNPELDEEENKNVGGILSLSTEQVVVAPINSPVVLYTECELIILSAIDIYGANYFDQCSDATCILYWSSLFDCTFDVEIGRTETVWKTTNPVWKNEKFRVKVPVVDEWSSIIIRIDVVDIAGPNDKTLLGTCSLSGWDLRKLLDRTGPATEESISYSLVDKRTSVGGDNSDKSLDAYPNSAAPRGSILLGGGRVVEAEEVIESPEENVSSVTGSEERKEGDSKALMRAFTKTKSALFGEGSDLGSKVTKQKVDKGNKVDFKVKSINSITLPVEMDKADTVPSSVLYYKVKFNDEVEEKHFVAGTDRITDGICTISYTTGKPLSFIYFLPPNNDPSQCTLELEVWVSVNKLHGSEEFVEDVNDLFIGYIDIPGTELVQLLRPKAPDRTYPLKTKGKNLINTQVNRYVRGGSLTIGGRVPDLARALSSRNISLKSSGSNWRSASKAHKSIAQEHDTPDPVLFQERYQLRVCEAGGLLKSGTLGGFGEIYADVIWRGEKIGSTQKMKSAPSSIPGRDGSATCEVVWENELFVLDKPEGEKLLDCELSVEVYERKSFSSGSIFLGCVTWAEDLLTEFLKEKDPQWFDLMTSHDKPPTEQKRVQGKLFIGAKSLSIEDMSSHVAGGWEFDTTQPLPEGMRDWDFSILSATGLGRADKFGKSDPYCIVKWNGIEIGKSSVCKRTLDPVWEDANFMIRTPVNLGPTGTVTSHIARSNSRRTSFMGSESTADIELSSRGRDRRRVAVPVSAVSMGTYAPRLDCVLTVEIWNWSASGDSVFLGAVELKGPELASYFEGNKLKRKSFKLSTTKALAKSKQKLVKGSVVLLVSPAISEKEGFSSRELEVEVAAAKSLNKVDRFGLADPYCVVRWNHRLCGKTGVIKNSLNPIWQNEIFQIRTTGKTEELERSLLYIEVWDFDVIGQGKFLGCVELGGKDLAELVETNNDFVWYDLEKSKYLQESAQQTAKGGSLQFRLGYSGTSLITNSNIASFELAILNAEDLSNNSFFGPVDSFCIVKSNGKEIGTTSVISKNSNPKWSGERFVVTMHTHVDTETGELTSATGVTVEIWSMLALGRGEFLGCVNLTYSDLVRLSEDCLSIKRSMTNTWFSLGKSPGLPESKQKNIQGRLRLGCKNFGYANVEEIGRSGESEVKFSWPTPQPTIAGTSLGLPSFELSILSCADLVVPSRLRRTIIPDPFCIVYLNDEEVGMTTVCAGTTDPVWREQETISLKIPENVDKQSYSVCIQVYNMLSLNKGEFLGQLRLSFWSLFCLQHGTFTFHLHPHDDDLDQYIKATITFSLQIYQPAWDGIKAYSSPGIERTVTVISASGLPDVNCMPPSTKCTIVVEGGIRARSSVESATSTPSWSPSATCDLSLDYRRPIRVVVQVLFVDVTDKREVCIGEVTIPHEFLLRPPSDTFELWLTASSRLPPKGYDFVVDGSVTLRISADGSGSSLWQPWTMRVRKPLVRHIVEDASEEATSELYVGPEQPLSTDECELLGSITVFSSSHILPTRPEWLIVPMKGMGVVIDGKSFGTHPLKQYCICVKRPPEKMARSDGTMVSEITEAVQNCLISIQRRDIYQHARNSSLNKLTVYFENLLRNNAFRLGLVFKRIANMCRTCFPGATLFLSLVSKDHYNMRYCLYDETVDNVDEPLFFTLWNGQGLEWACVGRHAEKRDICSVSDLIPNDGKYATMPISFCRFHQFRAPRLACPLRSGDVSIGVIGVENFDIYKAGSLSDLVDISDIQNWLSKVADLCGDVIYTGREKKVLKFLESYVLFSSSSKKGLVRISLEHGLSVLQGCRLMEVWSLRGRTLKSIATSWPESMTAPTRWVVLQDITVVFGKPEKSSGKDTKSIMTAAVTNFLFGTKPEETTDTIADESVESLSTVLEKGSPCGYVLGIYYGGFEQYQFVRHFQSSKDTEATFMHTFQDVKIYLSNDRNISLTLYCIDESVNIIDQYSGVFQLVTLKEKAVSCALMRSGSRSKFFKFTSSVSWPSASTKASQRVVALKALKGISKFDIIIHRAYGLCKTDIVGSSDPFCEIYWCDVLIGKTVVVNDSLEPVWEESFELPSEVVDGDGSYVCRVELWDMDFMGKGDFMGMFEIQLDQLLLPPTTEIEIPLSPKESLPKSKNKCVGGTVVITHTVEKKASDDVSDTKNKNDENSDDESEDLNSGGMYPLTKLERRVIQNILYLDDPVLKLTIEKASSLAKANMIGLSDPYVKVFKLDSPEREKDDPLAVTRAIDDTLSPVWNEDVFVNLNLKTSSGVPIVDPVGHMSKSKSSQVGLIDEWPIFVLEVWDKDNIGDGTFLGEVKLTPPLYALSRKFEGNLGPSPERDAKANRLAQGTISLSFSIQENAEKSMFTKFYFSPSRTLFRSTFAQVSILSAKSVTKNAKGFGKKPVNPFCVLRWNNEKIGETSFKKNSVDPTWANEKFTFDISRALIQAKWHDLVIEMWNKQGPVLEDSKHFLGEVKVSMLELLHPDQGEIVKRDLLTRPDPSSGAPQRKTGGTLCLRLARIFQPQRVTVQYKDAKLYPFDIDNQDDDEDDMIDPIENFFSHERVRVVTAEPVPLEIARDPEEERMRQYHEKIDLPGLLNKYSDLMNQYTSSPFDQVGLISELHYGQALSAFERNAASVLHIGESDTHLMPAVAPLTDMSTNITSYEKEFVEEDEDGGYLYDNEPPKQQIVMERDGEMGLVCRYPKGKVPKRDIKFISSLRDTMTKSLMLFEQREKRKIEIGLVLDKLTLMYGDIHRYTADDVVLTALRDVEFLFDCEVDIYLLQPGYDAVSGGGIKLMPCSRENGCIDDSSSPEDMLPLFKLCSNLCRHGILLQFYRGYNLVAGVDWKSGFSQAAMVSLESISNDVSVVERRGLCESIAKRAATEAPMGACVLPLMVGNEVVVGIMVISGTDKLPHSVYRLEKRKNPTEDTLKKRSEPDCDESPLGPLKLVRGFETREMMEEGTIASMRDLGMQLGRSIFASNVVAALKDVKTFPVRNDTDPEDVIRYAFRRLVEAIPMLVEVSIWKVLISAPRNKSETFEVDIHKKPDNKIGFGSIFSKPKKPTDDDKKIHQDVSEGARSGDVFDQTESDEKDLHNITKIESGYFKGECVSSILTTGNEKVLYQQLYNINEENDAPARGRKKVRPAADRGNAQPEGRRMAATVSTGAQVAFAISRNEYERVVPWTVNTPSCLRKESFAGVNTDGLEEEKNSVSDDIASTSSSSDSDGAITEEGEENDDNPDHAHDNELPNREQHRSGSINPLSRVMSAKPLDAIKQVSGQIGKQKNAAPVVSTNTDSFLADDPLEMAHLEIVRCVSDLRMKSFFLGTGGGVYLSQFARREDGVVDLILSRKFSKENNGPSISNSEPNSFRTHNDDTSETYVGEKKLKNIPGSSNVNTQDSFIPRSLSKDKPPLKTIPPPPQIPRPQVAGKNVKGRMKGKGRTEEATPSSVNPGPVYEYFLAVRTNGIGGDLGWGVVGNELAQQVDNMVQTLETVLAKIVSAKTKTGKAIGLSKGGDQKGPGTERN